jgi:hypothetical protein
MTGLAQLRGGYFTHPRDKLRYDSSTCANRELWLDFKLVVATFVKVLNRWLTLGLLLGADLPVRVVRPGRLPRPFRCVGGFQLSPFESDRPRPRRRRAVRQIPRTGSTSTGRRRTARCAASSSSRCRGPPRGRPGAAPARRRVLHALGFLLFFLFVSGEITDGFATARHARGGARGRRGRRCSASSRSSCRSHAGGARHGGYAPRRRDARQPGRARAYLVLGMPLVLVELLVRERREERDFWLVCTHAGDRRRAPHADADSGCWRSGSPARCSRGASRADVPAVRRRDARLLRCSWSASAVSGCRGRDRAESGRRCAHDRRARAERGPLGSALRPEPGRARSAGRQSPNGPRAPASSANDEHAPDARCSAPA